MIEETGKVISTGPEDTASDGTVWVETVRESTCGSCSAQKGCGHSVLEKIYEGQRHQVLATTDLKLEVGDEVVLGVPEDAVFRGSFVLYLVPMVFLILGMGTAGLLESTVDVNADLLFAIGGVLGLSVGVLFIQRHARINKENSEYLPAVIRRSSSVNYSSVAQPQPIHIR